MLIRTTLKLVGVLAAFLLAGCASPAPRQTPESKPATVQSAVTDQSTVETITRIVAKNLELDFREVDVDAPLSMQKKPADDLDVVEILMNVEDAFKIEIKDEDIGALEGVSRDLSIKKLADIISKKRSQK